MKKLLTLLMGLLIGFMVKAQWNSALDQNLLVASPNGSSFAANTNDGETYIGYWKSVPAPVNFELWVQLLDRNGNKQFGPAGIKVSDQIPMGSYTVVEKTAVDASKNLYIGVTGTGTGTPGYVFKITPQGTSAWPNGISLGEAFLPTILPLSGGDIAVAYFPPSQKYTRIQRYNSSGQPVWASPAQIISDDNNKNTLPADLFELPNEECEIIFHKQISFGTTSYLFAQKIGLKDGVKMWDSAKQIAPKTTAYNAKYTGAVDGNVVYYGYSTGENLRFDGYLQRVNTDGSLPWGLAGVDFDTNQTYFEKDMKIAFQPGTKYIWSIANYSSSSQGENGEFVQKFDKITGARLLTDQGKQVFPVNATSMYHYSDLQLVDGNPYFMVQKKEGTALNVSLNAVLLNDNGNFAWTQQYIPVATFQASKAYTTVLKPVNGQSVVVFQEKKATDNTLSVYAQNLVFPEGTMGTHDISTEKPVIRLYPNPAVNSIHMDGVKDQTFTIYNVTGQLVKSGSMVRGEIEVTDLIKGAYILKIKEIQEGIKFIKK